VILRPCSRRELLEEYRAIVSEHEHVVRRINRTNLAVRIRIDQEDGTLADAIVRRERLAHEAGLLRELASHAAPSRNRFLRTEVRHMPTVDVATVLGEADELSQAHRALDVRIQQANWDTELIE
jgi:hypothetical protein